MDDVTAKALARNDRYLMEVIERLSLCPFARSCREAGRLHREVVLEAAPDPVQVAERIRAVPLEPEGDIEIALFLFPQVPLDAPAWERFVSEVRAVLDQLRRGPATGFVVAFHPNMTMNLDSPDRAVPFMRRSPDPTIQLVSARSLEKVGDAAGGPEALSRRIAEAGLRAVMEEGPERVKELLAAIHAGRNLQR
jgi:hypothetical protein